MALNHACFRAEMGIPDLDGAVAATGGQALAIGAEGHLVDALGVAPEKRQFPAGVHIPRFQFGVSRGFKVSFLAGGGGQLFAVRTYGQVKYTAPESAQAVHGGRAFCLPDQDFTVMDRSIWVRDQAAGDDPLAVRMESHGEHLSQMAPKIEKLFPVSSVPHPCRPVQTAGNDPSSVRAERDTYHRFGVTANDEG